MYATEEQARILREAVAVIKANPATFDMGDWTNHCGTVCCLAGHVVRNSVGAEQWAEVVNNEFAWKGYEPSIRQRASDLLKIGEEEEDVLFHLEGWPCEFVTNEVVVDDDDGREYEFESTTADLLAARVERWIETGE